MRHLKMNSVVSVSHAVPSDRRIVAFSFTLSISLLLAGGLVGCGTVGAGQEAHSTPTTAPTPTATLTPSPTLAPTPSLSSTGILDVRPSSMSIFGPADCSRSAVYTCTAE